MMARGENMIRWLGVGGCVEQGNAGHEEVETVEEGGNLKKYKGTNKSPII
jgi:hypothetical protein